MARRDPQGILAAAVAKRVLTAPVTVDVAGVATTVIDTGPADTGLPPVLLLHGSGPGVSAAANGRLSRR